MTRRAYRNYIKMKTYQINHKKLCKAKKQWIVVGISLLVATGLAKNTNLITHAKTNSNQIRQTQVTKRAPYQVEKRAQRLHRIILKHASRIRAINKSNQKAISINAQIPKVESGQHTKVRFNSNYLKRDKSVLITNDHDGYIFNTHIAIRYNGKVVKWLFIPDKALTMHSYIDLKNTLVQLGETGYAFSSDGPKIDDTEDGTGNRDLRIYNHHIKNDKVYSYIKATKLVPYQVETVYKGHVITTPIKVDGGSGNHLEDKNVVVPNGYKLANPYRRFQVNKGSLDKVQLVKISNQTPQIPQTPRVPKKQKHSDNQPMPTPEPKSDSVTLNYEDKGVSEGTYTTYGSGTINITNHNVPGMPKGFHLVGKSNIFNFDGQTHNVEVTSDASNQPQPPTSHPIQNVDQLKIGQRGSLKGYTVERFGVPKHFRWFLAKRTSFIHNDILSVGHGSNYSGRIRPYDGSNHRISKIFKVTFKHHSELRYEINLNGYHYFVTGNPDYTLNTYLQPSDMNGNTTIKLTRPACEYKSRYFTSKTRIKNLKRGQTLHIKKVINIGRKGDYQTRFILSNGNYVTANKNFVKTID